MFDKYTSQINKIGGYLHIGSIIAFLTLTQIFVVSYVLILGYVSRIIQAERLPTSPSKLTSLLHDGILQITVLLVYFVVPSLTIGIFTIYVSLQSDINTTITLSIVTLFTILCLLYILPSAMIHVSTHRKIDEVIQIKDIIKKSLSKQYIIKQIKCYLFIFPFCGFLLYIYIYEYFTQLYLLLCLNVVVVIFCAYIFRNFQVN